MARSSPVEKGLVALAVIACVFTGTTFAFSRPETHFVALSLMGRLHDGCGWRASLDAATYERARNAARSDVARRSRILQRDGSLTLWQSPHGQAWAQVDQTEGWASFWAGDVHHWPPRWARLDAVPVVPVKAGSIVIDAGGHLGESTNHALKMGAELVVAIEPDPLNAEAFRRNLADPIKAGRVKLIEKALWDSEGTLTLHRHETSAQTTAALGSAHGAEISVPMTTLDRIVQELNLERVDFIKMDIEGAEQPALRGAVQTLKQNRPILAIGSYHKRDDLDGIPRIVQGAEPRYTMTPLRCLMASGRVKPYLLYFHVAEQ